MGIVQIENPRGYYLHMRQLSQPHQKMSSAAFEKKFQNEISCSRSDIFYSS